MQELNLYSEPFLNEEPTINFLVLLNILKLDILCPNCQGRTKLYEDDKYHGGKYFRCTTKTCRKKTSIVYNTLFEHPRVKLNYILRYIY